MRRDLVSVRKPRTKIGAVISDANGKHFDGAAGGVLQGMRREFGDDQTIDLVLEQGWANGAGLYFTDLVPGR